MTTKTKNSESHHLFIEGECFKVPELTPKMLEYSEAHSLIPHPYLEELRHHAKAVDMNFMQVPTIQASLLYLLVKIVNAQNILEVGCYLGYSTIALAAALPDNGKIITVDRSKKWSTIALENFKKAGLENKIELRRGEARQILDALNLENVHSRFDLIFIDADKHNSLNYYKMTLPFLRAGGVMVIDNVLWRGNIVNNLENSSRAQALDELNTFVKNDPCVEPVLLPLFDGILLLRKK